MPILSPFPKEHLSFNKTVSFLQSSNLSHLLIRKRILSNTFQVTYIVMHRKRNRNLPSLMSPLQRNECRMHTMRLRDLLHLRSLHIRNILRTNISFRTSWGTKRHISNRLDIMRNQIIILLLLLEARMKFQFTRCRFDLHQRQNSLKFRNCHIGNTNITDLTFFYKFFTLAVCIHKFLNAERSGVWISGIYITEWCMIVREWPVDEVQIHIIAPKILNALCAGFFYFSVHVIPYFCHDEKVFSFYNTLIDRCFENFTDLVFISIACCTVKHTISAAECSCNCCRYVFCAYTVGTKGSHSDTWCFITCVEFYFWHICRINKFTHDNSPFI